MERTLDWMRGYARLAWWDGSALDLRLHRLTDIIDALAGVPEADPALVPAHWRTRAEGRGMSDRAPATWEPATWEPATWEPANWALGERA
jgi:hypothetical protein